MPEKVKLEIDIPFQKAKEEGFPQIAAQFHMIAELEKIHGDRFTMIADMLRDNKLFSKLSSLSLQMVYCYLMVESILQIRYN
ncbi:hypothetical protein [Lachnoclostridium sp.]|uniref:hypothetical protein n=1 Tax=Lachnoclostridium sp. TaxID=2028282 RepID=UPI0028A0273D|nr:hypothetical protein [Lachnoclostridium sp.]